MTQTLGAAAPMVRLDDADNSALLPGNADRDVRGDECDCAPMDPGAFAIPEEVVGLTLEADKVTLTWESAAPRAGSGTVHDVLRGAVGEFPVGSGPSETCLASGVLGAMAADPATPGAGSGSWYLVRGRNACGPGNYGLQSDGTLRTSDACP